MAHLAGGRYLVVMRGEVLALVAAAAFWAPVAPASEAQGKVVSLGEVTTRVVRRDVDLEAALRGALDEELAAADLGRVPPNRWMILSASLVRMDSDAVVPSVSCVVSATLRGARGGAMVAILEGKARVEGGGVLTAAVERRAVRAAAHAALVRLRDAVR